MKYRELKKYKYQLVEDAYYKGVGSPDAHTDFIELTDGTLRIKKGYAWDGASGPAIDTKNFMLGSLVHDALYQLMGMGLMPKMYRQHADRILQIICMRQGMSKFRAWYVYQAVRVFGGFYLNKKNYPAYEIKEI